MELVSRIGKRYLWVDSLCIVQDDDNDKQQQLTIIDSIYSNAEFVIMAAAGDNASAGLPGVGSTIRRIFQGIEDIDRVKLITIQPPAQAVVQKSVWIRRGWTFQEIMLSRRALVFTQSLVYWNCQVTSLREDLSNDFSVIDIHLDLNNSLWPNLISNRDQCRTSLYCELAEAFSSR